MYTTYNPSKRHYDSNSASQNYPGKIHHHLAAEVQDVTDITMGFSGSFVYLIDVAGFKEPLKCIAKFTPAEHNEDNSVANRVYGSHVSSFRAVYACLRQNQIPVPKLYAAYNPEPEIPFCVQLMEFLPGQDVNQVLESTSPEEQSDLQQFLGDQLGVIHRITRSYDGWVDVLAPYPLSWHDAFFTALYGNLDSACNHSVIAEQRSKILNTIAYYEAQWTDPTGFVLSHLDGLQGIIAKTSIGWQFIGAIDIEDHYFTDQRFVLSILELEAEIEDISILPDFWAAYERLTTRDATYRTLRPLFQLYVLIDWIKDQPMEQHQIIGDFSHKIAERCQF